jgi:hypothetical protein
MISCCSLSPAKEKNFIFLKSSGRKTGSFEKNRTQPASPQAKTIKPLSKNFFSIAGRIFSRT